MQIKKMTAHFGALDGKSLALQPGLNVLRAPNESGKSTWCAFLKAMLYGVDTAQRAKQGQHPDKVKYRPWSGESMSGSLELETSDGPVTLRRWTEQQSRPMQAFSATVTGTDAPVPGIIGDNAGQVLTGVGREVFERSAFIRQSGMGFKNAPELEKRLIALVCSGDEEQSYQESDQRLRAWLRRRRSTGKRGAIPEVEADIVRAERELADITAAARQTDALSAELAQAEAKQAETVKWMERARSEARRKALADLSAARSAVAAGEEARRQAEVAKEQTDEALRETPFGVMGLEQAQRQVQADMDEADALAYRTDALPKPWLALIPLVLGAVLLCLAFFWSKAVFLVGALAYVAVILALGRWRGNILRKENDLLSQREDILKGYGVQDPEDIAGLLDKYEELWQNDQDASAALEAADNALEKARAEQRRAEDLVLNGLDFENGTGEAARATRAVKQGQADIERLKERRAQAEGRARALGDPMVLRSALEELKLRREELLAQEEALKLALESLEYADRALQERFSPLLAAHGLEYFAFLTDGRYDEITLARDLTAKARLSGDAVGWDTDYLSDGTKDQLYLAMRLAVSELVLPAEQGCPIILDDALITFDQARLERALELLKTVAETRQVLLFTCHDREFNYFDADPAVNKIRLGEYSQEDVDHG